MDEHEIIQNTIDKPCGVNMHVEAISDVSNVIFLLTLSLSNKHAVAWSKPQVKTKKVSRACLNLLALSNRVSPSKHAVPTESQRLNPNPYRGVILVVTAKGVFFRRSLPSSLGWSDIARDSKGRFVSKESALTPLWSDLGSSVASPLKRMSSLKKHAPKKRKSSLEWPSGDIWLVNSPHTSKKGCGCGRA